MKTGHGEDVVNRPWAILPERLLALGSAIGGPAWAAPAMATARRNFGGPYGSIAIIPIRSVITHRDSLRNRLSGGTSIQMLTQQFRNALADSGTRAIVFDCDSPGGEVEGIPEFADEIFRARARKRIVAVANPSACAGAYWLACAASELTVIPSGEVGSVGIVAVHEDSSKALESDGVKVSLISAGKFKTDGNPFEPLSASGRADLQRKVNALQQMFINAIARGRGASTAKVRMGFGQGRTVLATKAVAEGMADRVETLDQTLARLATGRGNPARPKAAGVPIELLELELDLIGLGSCLEEGSRHGR